MKYGDLVTPIEDIESVTKSGLLKDEALVFMGEITQMPGHCILAKLEDGKIYAGLHIDNFRILTDDEV